MAKTIKVALAGNANVGKSVIFNYLTGLHQHIGNWPGKTVEKAEGTLHFRGYTIDIIDLPGIYSLSAYSIEEQITRNYIVMEKPDVVINVIDASTLERNLYFTLQLIELGRPMIIALNQVDQAAKKGIHIDIKKLEEILGVPVIPTIAIKGVGIYQLMEKVIEIARKGINTQNNYVKLGREIEERIERLVKLIEGLGLRYPARYAAIKLLEGDEEVENEVNKLNPALIMVARQLAKEIESIEGRPCGEAIIAERYEKACNIAREVERITSPARTKLIEKLDELTIHRLWGYPIMISLLLIMFYTIFTVGGYISDLLNALFYNGQTLFNSISRAGPIGELFWSAAEGIIAGVTVIFPYLVPLYIVLYLLEDSGYISRVAFLMDSLMHRMGLHGKAFIPLLLGYGCNVPACIGCRILETQRERTIATFIVTLVPCAARTIIILSLVGKFLGIEYALAIYIFNLAIIFLLGRIAFKALPGEPTALIMEMHEYRMPHVKTVLKQTWFRIFEFIKIAFPLIVLGSVAIKMIELFGLTGPIVAALSPITVSWLGLPMMTGITLIFGILRKELMVILLSTIFGTSNFLDIQGFGPINMIVFTVVAMFYIPCISTIAALMKEIGWKKAFLITIFEIFFAILLGGIVYRFLRIILG
ncbi:MAG: ferrous iron transport protein B [Nitrososphaerota archaeon]